MSHRIDARRVALRTARAFGRIAHLAARIGKVLTLSAGHDAVWPEWSLCACIEEGRLAVVLGRRIFSRIRIARARVYPAEDGGYPPVDSVASDVRQAAVDFRASTRSLTLVMPKPWAIARTVELPAAVRGNLSQAVEFELDRLTPLASTDALYDFTTLSVNGEKVELSLSVCRSDTVTRHVKALEGQGIRVGRVTTAVSALAAFSEYGKGPAVKANAPGLLPTEIGSVIESLWPKAQATNLLAKGKGVKKRPPLALTIILLAVLASIAVVHAVLPLNIEQRRLAEIDRQIKLLKQPVRQVEQLKKEMEAEEKEVGSIDSFKGDRVLTIDIIREITKILPKSVWLTRIRITDTTVDLEGYAGSASDILPKLATSPYLKKVEFASPTFRDMRLNTDRFVIKAEIENRKKADAGSVKDGVKK